MKILGIDPGLSGGLCILDEKEIIECIKMPICTRPNRKGNYIDMDLIYAFICKHNSSELGTLISAVYIERQFILRSQGMSSGSKTMYQSGLLYGLCFSLVDSLHEINAKDWQAPIFKQVDQSKVNSYNYSSDTKLQSIAYVEQNYDKSYLFHSKRQTKPSDGLADAICIAQYGLLQESKTKTTKKRK